MFFGVNERDVLMNVLKHRIHSMNLDSNALLLYTLDIMTFKDVESDIIVVLLISDFSWKIVNNKIIINAEFLIR